MVNSKIQILAFGAHPDDVEMSCAGTLMKQKSLGHKFGIIDLTQGELGTRGNALIRAKEAKEAAGVIGAEFRENMKFRDGFFVNDKVHQLALVKVIRRHTPEIILANAVNDRHPDHGRAAALVNQAAFLSGLIKIKTLYRGKNQRPWRPKIVLHYIQDLDLKPDFVIDISNFATLKMKSIYSYSSQFYDKESIEPPTYISQPGFLDALRGRMRLWGKAIGVEYAEGFTVNRLFGVGNLFDIK